MLLAAQHNVLAASQLVVSGRGRLLGYSIREDAGTPAAAAVSFYDGVSTGGRIFHSISLPAGGAANLWFGPQGIQFNTGFYVGGYIGSLFGTVYFLTEELIGSNVGVQSNNFDDKIFTRISLHDFMRLINEVA